MKRLLDDYVFDSGLRYEAHVLRYKPGQVDEMPLGGILGAAVLCALLADTDEGDDRGIAVDEPQQRESFFQRYEREVRRDNGGMFKTEVEALSQAYIELTGSDVLATICRNERLFDLAFGLVIEYMERLVKEQAGEHIYQVFPWQMPFAQWLYDAGFIETRRQQLLSIDWTNAAEVYALEAQLNDTQNQEQAPEEEPTFYFEGENAEKIMNDYYYWLLQQLQAEADMMPDAQQRLAQLKAYALQQETDWKFLQSDIAKLTPQAINVFRSWMKQWTEFITSKLGDTPDTTFPPQDSAIRTKQVLFPDKILPCPPENNYVEVCKYIAERCRYDKDFAKYYREHSRVQLCEQLTAMFGWVVSPNHLGKRIKNHQIS